MPTARPLVIIHGWSDHSASFKQLAYQLAERSARKPLIVDLADYISMDDDITFSDITSSMDQAWRKHQLPIRARSVDVIVHSTGGLIVRDWLVRYFEPGKAPIYHLVMLAPANFGSHIAHKGRAFYSRIIKGLKGRKPFNVGAKLLRGLELSSPYTWHLAMQDRFNGDNYYGPGKILCTVLIGTEGLKGIAAVANQIDSDGVVRFSCANLNCAYLEADFTDNPLQPTYHLETSQDWIGFGLLPNVNHRSITAKNTKSHDSHTLQTIQRALTVTDKRFIHWCESLTTANLQFNPSESKQHQITGYQNTVFHVQNQYGQDVDEYFLEFYDANCKEGRFSEMFYEQAIYTTHAFSANKSYRNFYINCNLLSQLKSCKGMHISLVAHPQFDKRHNVVGYHSLTDKGLGSIFLTREQMATVFKPHRTLLVHLTLLREQAESVFELQRFIGGKKSNKKR